MLHLSSRRVCDKNGALLICASSTLISQETRPFCVGLTAGWRWLPSARNQVGTKWMGGQHWVYWWIVHGFVNPNVVMNTRATNCGNSGGLSLPIAWRKLQNYSTSQPNLNLLDSTQHRYSARDRSRNNIDFGPILDYRIFGLLERSQFHPVQTSRACVGATWLMWTTC